MTEIILHVGAAFTPPDGYALIGIDHDGRLVECATWLMVEEREWIAARDRTLEAEQEEPSQLSL